MKENEPLDAPNSENLPPTRHISLPLLLADILIMVLMPLAGMTLLISFGATEASLSNLLLPMTIGLMSYHISRWTKKPVERTGQVLLTIGIGIGIAFCSYIFIHFYDVIGTLLNVSEDEDAIIFLLLALPFMATIFAILLCLIELWKLWKK